MWILNPETKRYVKFRGPVHTKLINRGVELGEPVENKPLPKNKRPVNKINDKEDQKDKPDVNLSNKRVKHNIPYDNIPVEHDKLIEAKPGYIISPKTGNPIKNKGPGYKNLVYEGYIIGVKDPLQPYKEMNKDQILTLFKIHNIRYGFYNNKNKNDMIKKLYEAENSKGIKRMTNYEMKIKCFSCGSKKDQGSNFCDSCLNKIDICRCPICMDDEIDMKESKFCPSCLKTIFCQDCAKESAIKACPYCRSDVTILNINLKQVAKNEEDERRRQLDEDRQLARRIQDEWNRGG